MITPADIAPDRVAIYIRWSTDDQSQGTTLETQLERCRHYLGSQGWEFCDHLVYIDDGYSGGTLDRPALTRLRGDIAAGRVECVVVYKIDRLSRSVVDIVDLALREWEGRCFIKSTSEEVNTISPAGKMFFYILVSFAEYERNLIRERTMNGKIKRAEQGLNPGFRPPYGYQTGQTPGVFAVVEHEAIVVQRIFALYHKGNGVHQIAHAFNSEGLTNRGKLWKPLAVRRILGNPAYIGVLTYGKSSRTTREQRERHGMGTTIKYDQPRFARVAGAYPALVEQSLWDECQALLTARSNQHRERTTKPSYSGYLLSGLAVCRCGAPVHAKVVSGGRRKASSHAYYQCSARKRYGPAVCDAGHVPMALVDGVIESRVRTLLEQHGRRAVLGTLEAEITKRAQAVKAAADGTRSAMESVAGRLHRLERDYRSGDLPANLYAKEARALEQERQGTEAAAARLGQALMEIENFRVNKTGWLKAAERIDLWSDLQMAERKQLLRKLIQAVVIYRPNRSQAPPVIQISWIQLNPGA